MFSQPTDYEKLFTRRYFLVLAFYLIWEQGSQQAEENNFPSIPQSETKTARPTSDGNQTWDVNQNREDSPDSFTLNEFGIKPANELGDEIITTRFID